MSRMAETSLEAYRKKIENGSKQTDEQRCFKLIDEKGPLTMKAMEPFMDKNKHKFSGRIRDLKDKGLVEKVGTRDGHQVLEVNQGLDDEGGLGCRDEMVFADSSIEEKDTEGLFVDSTQKQEKVCSDSEQNVLMEDGEVKI